VPNEDYYPHYELEYYGGRNSYRMPAYHRLDLSANFHKTKKWGKRTLSVGLYNAYNNKNAFFLYFRHDEHNNMRLYKVSIFPFMPSIKYSVKF
jgi:hypothetical protein